MIVIADTSPLQYLVLIECDWVLPELYGNVLLPAAVLHELGHLSTPKAVRIWMDAKPAWVEVSPAYIELLPELAYLGDGEREAISLAETVPSPLVLMDDRQGRAEAARRGVMTTGTLGVLLQAHRIGLLDAGKAYATLVDETSFRTSLKFEAEFRNRFSRTHASVVV